MAKQIHVGSRIKQEMQNARMTVNDVSEHLKISKSAVYDIFKKKDVSTSLLRDLSSLFQVPMSVFVEEPTDSSAELTKILTACRDLKNDYKQFDSTISKLFEAVNLKK